MSDSLTFFIGLVDLIIFYIADFFYARALASQKNALPELEECSPNGSPDLDTAAVLDSLATTAADFYQHERTRLTGVQPPSSSQAEYANLDAIAESTITGRSSALNPLHTYVVVCGVVGPVLTGLMLLAPGLMSWTTFSLPTWLAYLAVVPGLAAAGLYASRAFSLHQMVEMTKTEWIAMMWFRLDFMFILGAVAFFGLGAWMVSVCLVSVAAYLAHRVLKMEKHLNNIQKNTQLLRGEVDVTRVHVPGSAESKKAMGIDEGYSAL